MKYLTIILSFIVSSVMAQFAPAAGQSGSKAIYKDSSIIVAWAASWQNYIVGDDVDTTWQHPEKALGPAQGTSTDIVCLGRGGQITFIFDTLIVNKPGPDFVCFENGFSDTFLELSWVEVSKDGINFERFPNYSYTQQAVGGFGNVNPEKISGYCSKYRQGYGTPFDLDSVSLDTVRYVRIVDIVGDSTCFDSNNHVIYDPYPTSGSAGVDIDAIGVINLIETTGVEQISYNNKIKIYPNPVKNTLVLEIEEEQLKIKNANNIVYIYDIYGKIVKQFKIQNSKFKIQIGDLQKGIYFVKFENITSRIVKI